MSKELFKPVQKRKLVDEILEQLQNKIFSGQFKPGDKLPTETELMEQLSVGRSTVREAVKILVHAEVLQVRHGDGTYIKSVKHPESYLKSAKRYNEQHIYEVRKMLDMQLCEIAVANRTEEDLEKMQTYLTQRKKALDSGNYADYVEADVYFHFALAQSTQNELFIDLYRDFCAILKKYLSNLIVKDIRQYDDSTVIHEQLLLAIRERNVEEAKLLTLENLKQISGEKDNII
ncbi:FadR/GntR family transcriptional regulator [Gorillibacterium massiliense]|uniref:FadR/GntR family transcriptional regulator n=1 Tax=Gorillibacterium massiliense TaxID=1280390 RepID=UPI00059335DE|nr:FadR/GntR family transcriptional regulator [Gorillibacterium massiliense]